MGLPLLLRASGLTTSFAPITSATSVRPNSWFASSISFSSSYGTFASARSTFMWPGMRPATGWIAYFTVAPSFFRMSAISRSACCACATAMPAEDHVEDRAVHPLAHDVAKDRARGADERAGDDERRVAEREADPRRG